MENWCRLCGSDEGFKVDIFEPGSERVKRIHKVLPILVNEHDPFPKHMCHHCSYKVEQFYEFRAISLKTQEMLRSKVSWLKDKKSRKNVPKSTMVEVSATQKVVNAVSPNERVNQPDSTNYEDNAIVIDDDSPPTFEDSTNAACSETDNQTAQASKPKKSKKSRSLWDTKKRKKNNRKPCQILEVFSTNEQVYQNLNNNENNPLPLRPSAIVNIEDDSSDAVENNPRAVNRPRKEPGAEKGILTDDKGDNIVLPKYMLVAKIPRVGNIYTCEKCGVTYVNPVPAMAHRCAAVIAASAEEERQKEDSPPHPQEEEKNEAKDFYQCDECDKVFMRHSQLVSHQKMHSNQQESSTDDSFKPFNKRKRNYTKKRKHKDRLLNRPTDNYNSNMTDKQIWNGEDAVTQSSSYEVIQLS